MTPTRFDPKRFKAAVSRLGPLYRWARRGRALGRFAARRPHDPDFRAFRHFAARDGLFLDVGASIGQSALSFRIFNRRAPILSVEALPSHRGDLEFVKRAIRRFDYRIAAAADADGTAVLHVPVWRGYELPAESSLRREDAQAVLDRLRNEGAADSELRLDEVEVQRRRLDELGLAPAFVKIDVEGAELGVVRGLLETISTHRPLMMVERSESVEELAWLLAPMGYSPFAYEPERDVLQPFTGQDALNVFFLVEEDCALAPLQRDP